MNEKKIGFERLFESLGRMVAVVLEDQKQVVVVEYLLVDVYMILADLQ
jgi:hypothetical protein